MRASSHRFCRTRVYVCVCVYIYIYILPELSNKMVKEDGGFKPGHVEPGAQPSSASKWSEEAVAAAAHLSVLCEVIIAIELTQKAQNKNN